MPRVTFVEPGGAERVVEAVVGDSLMRAAKNNGVAGIVADCGGACQCATCHVFVDASRFATVGPPNDMEAAMLEFAEDAEPTSRLSCQIRVTDALEGLRVRVAANAG